MSKVNMSIQQFTIYEEVTGRIVTSGTGSFSDNGVPPDLAGLGNLVLMGSSTTEPGLHYVESGQLVRMSERPSASHDWDYSTKQWVGNLDAAWGTVRIERDRILRSSDWRVTKAAELGQPIDLAWAVYRQALRNITSQTDPLNIVWPTVPT